jgi:glycosyltransferase involved in cell wall biosynthesis
VRIGLTSTTIEPAVTNGHIDGIGTYTKNLYETLLKTSNSVVPYAFPHMKKPAISSLHQGKFFRWPYSASTIASFLNPTSFNIHGNLKKHIDILHVTDHMLPKVSNIPIVATICDALMFNNSHWHWDTIRLANLKKWMRKKTIHWADHFITISNAMIPELVEHIGIKEEKISVVYLGIQQEWFDKASDAQKHATRKKYNLPEHFLLFTGTLQHKKNLPRIIKAYLQLPSDIQDQYPLIVVGRPGWGMDESLSAIQELTAKKKGAWLNYVPIEELRILFQCASLYIHPSLHEGFGLTLLEAFASETPTLTSNVTALPEVANQAAYIVNPYSIDEIRTGIQHLLTSSTSREELVQKGIARAKEFSWERCANKTLKVYETFI